MSLPLRKTGPHSARVVLFCFSSLIGLFATQVASASDSDRAFAAFASLRASFNLSGRVVDEEGNTIRDLTAVIGKGRYEPGDMRVHYEEERLGLDGDFTLAYDDLTCIRIRTYKTGYHVGSYDITFEQVLRGKAATPEEVQRLCRPTAGNIPAELSYSRSDIVITMRRIREPLPVLCKSNSLMKVTLDRRTDEAKIQSRLGRATKVTLFLETAGTPDTNTSVFYLGCRGGGICVAQSQIEFDSIIEAPVTGYLARSVLGSPGSQQDFSFYLRTADNLYGKGTGTFYCERTDGQVSGARVVVHMLALQENGTRCLETSGNDGAIGVGR